MNVLDQIPGRIGPLSPSKPIGMVLDANDRDVIEACRQGDADAFRLLFEAHKDRVYSIALRYSGNPAAAMDIAQDTFVKLLSSIQNFRGSASFDSWLYRIVVNACLDHQRGGRRVAPFLDGLLDAVAAPAESILTRLVRDEQDHTVQEIVARLRPSRGLWWFFGTPRGSLTTRFRKLSGARRGPWRRG